MTIKDFQEYVLKLKQDIGFPGTLNSDEGLLLGSPEMEVKGIFACWMGSVDALRKAAAEGCNLVVVHELFYFWPFLYQGGFQPQFLTWPANRRRIEAAERNGLNVMRLHGTLDVIHNFEDFAELIGLKVEKRGGGLYRVFPIEETTVGELVTRLKRVLKLERVRMVGDLNRRVRCVGLAMGGLCLDSNVGYMQRCIELGADVLIGGEADEYGFLFAADADIPCIETGHFLSETPGILNFVKRLRKNFPAIKAVGYDERRPFEYR